MTWESAEENLPNLGDAGFDIVVCSYRLPGMNGLDFIRQLLARLTPPPWTLLLTPGNDRQTAGLAEKAGVHCILEKPVTVNRFARAIDHLLADLMETDCPCVTKKRELP